MKKLLTILVLLSFSLVLFTGPACASQAVAKSAVDLSSILNIPGLSVSWSLNDPASFASATADPFLSDFQALSSWPVGTGFSATAAVPIGPGPYSATATGTVANPAATTLKLGALAQSGPTGVDMPTATASAAVSMTYSYSGPNAEITFALPYNLNLSLLSSGVPNTPSLAYGFSSLDFIMTKGMSTLEDQIFYMSTTKKDGKFLNFPDGGDLNKGTYTFSVNLANGDAGTFDFRTYATTSAVATVPIPGAIWLLGTGLIGLVGIRRRQSK